MDIQTKKKSRLINELVAAIQDSNLAIFAGAGLSIPAGYVNWKQLLEPIADDLDLDIEKEASNLVQLAQYHCNAKNNRGTLNQLLVNEFSKKAELTENHRILARLPIDTFWTTNYDKMIESALTDAGKTPDVKYTNSQLAYTVPKRDAIVYKMHGDVDHPGEAILTKDDYESYHVKMQPFLNALSGDLIAKTFLFLGFSFSDPNLDYILSRVRIAYNKDQRPHYCLLKKLDQETGESDADFEYRKRKQELFIHDLNRFAVQTVVVDKYSEITEILKDLEGMIKSKSIFISGAAAEYAPHDQITSEKFVYELSKELIYRELKIVSGFGLGVGSSVISGALESIYMSGHKLDDDQLLLRPFPQNQIGKTDLNLLWTKYREDMISYAGIAIFLFGNKLKDEKIVHSSGMKEEYDIALSQGVFVIPVGATGYMAKELWLDLKEKIRTGKYSFPIDISEEFELLGNDSKSLDEIKDLILKLVLRINKGA